MMRIERMIGPARLDGRTHSRRWLRASAAAIVVLALTLGATISAPPASAVPPLDAHFIGWTLNKGQDVARDADATMAQETSDVHSGSGALLVHNRSPLGKYIFLEQSIPVTPGATYQITAWAKSDGMPSAGFTGTLSPDWAERIVFPTGQYDWQPLTWTYTAHADQSTLALKLITEGITSRLLVDDLSIVETGTSAELLVNGGFDQVAAALPSDARFANWNLNKGSDPARDAVASMSQSTTSTHSGSGALRVENRTPAGNSRYIFLEQVIPVKPGTTYDIGAWAKSQGMPNAGLSGTLSPDWAERITFPNDVYDWRQLGWTYTTKADQTTIDFRLITEGITPEILVDDLTVTERSASANLVANGSFDLLASDITVTDPSLLSQPGQTHLHVTSASAQLDWTARRMDSTVALTGTAAVSGSADLDLSALPAGYYSVTIAPSGAGADQSVTTSIGIIRPTTKDARFGVGMHLGAPGYDAVTPDAATLGFGNVRFDAWWQQIEQTPGQYVYPADLEARVADLRARGMTPFPIAVYNNPLYDNGHFPQSAAALDAYARFATAVAQHWASGQAIELYNEPNNAGITTGGPECRTDPTCFVHLLSAAATRIRADSPNTTIVAPGLAYVDDGWLTRLYQSGGLASLDAVSVHPYRSDNPELMVPLLQQAQARIREYNGGLNKPLWLSELGWPTIPGVVTETVQADYLARSQALAFENGVTKYFWYDLLNDGTLPTDREQNFGLFRQPTPQVAAAAPKPAAIAQAALIESLGGRPFTGSDNVPGAHSVVFGGATDPVRAMWSEAPTSTIVSTAGPLTLTGQYGERTTLSPVDGKVYLDLGPSAVYLAGPLSSVAIASAPALSVSVAPVVGAGVPVTATVTVDRRGGVALPSELTVHVGGGTVSVATQADAVVTATVTLDGTDARGPRHIGAYVEGPSGTIGYVDADTTVGDVFTLAGTPRVTAVNPFGSALVVSLGNRSASAAAVRSIEWSVGPASGTITDVAIIGAGATGDTVIAVPGVVPVARYPYALTATLADGTVLAASGTTSFVAIEKEGSQTLPAVDLLRDGVPTYSRPYGGVNDLSGDARVTWDDAGLVVQAHVVDDVFSAPATPDSMYLNDSLQMAVSPGLPGSTPKRIELGVGIIAGQPVANIWAPAPGRPAGVIALPGLTAQRSGTSTDYRFSIPWDVLGLAGAPADRFALSLLVNDDDLDGHPRGFVEWGAGIASNKQTADMNTVQLFGAPASADATLVSMSVAGSGVPGFVPGTRDYAVQLPWGSETVPTVTAIPTDAGAHVTIEPAGTIPGSTTARVVAADGLTRATYAVFFSAARHKACTSTITGRVTRSLVVSRGALCVTSASVEGSVIVAAGASIFVEDSTITGSVVAVAADQVLVTRSSVSGNIALTAGRGQAIVDSARVSGSVLVAASRADTTIGANRIRGSLTCAYNRDSPTNFGRSNVVSGHKLGQCVDL